MIDVVISTAGSGSRLHKINSEINKALLPYLNKPIIHHIIEKIPKELKIGILLGYKSQQVRDYVTLAFPNQLFEFIYVDDWTSGKSGTGYSLSFARNFLKKSFWYFPCDGIYENTDFFNENFSEDVFVVERIDQNQAHHYLTFNLVENRISQQYFKSVDISGNFAFTGAMKISDKDLFFDKLEQSNSNEFVSIIPKFSLVHFTNGWKDFGNYEKYENELSETEEFDFSKTGEYTYQLDDSIIKWWADPSVALQKLNKPSANPKVFPTKIKSLNQFLTYSKAPGSSFYENVDPDNFILLLNWLREKLWTSEGIDIKENLLKFYKDKTISRIEILGNKKELDGYKPTSINNVEVKAWQHYFNNINWDFLVEQNYPSFIHGDLQFDNIIFDKEAGNFTLIDWRHDFSGLNLTGDLYYDFAKMLGGIYINYQSIKKGKFNFKIHDNIATFKLPEVNKSNELISILELHASQLGLDVKKIRQLVPLIFWNMAPLHKEPFSNLCWSLGIMHYEILEKK